MGEFIKRVTVLLSAAIEENKILTLKGLTNGERAKILKKCANGDWTQIIAKDVPDFMRSTFIHNYKTFVWHNPPLMDVKDKNRLMETMVNRRWSFIFLEGDWNSDKAEEKVYMVPPILKALKEQNFEFSFNSKFVKAYILKNLCGVNYSNGAENFASEEINIYSSTCLNRERTIVRVCDIFFDSEKKLCCFKFQVRPKSSCISDLRYHTNMTETAVYGFIRREGDRELQPKLDYSSRCETMVRAEISDCVLDKDRGVIRASNYYVIHTSGLSGDLQKDISLLEKLGFETDGVDRVFGYTPNDYLVGFTIFVKRERDEKYARRVSARISDIYHITEDGIKVCNM